MKRCAAGPLLPDDHAMIRPCLDGWGEADGGTSLSDAVATERAPTTRPDHPPWHGMDAATVAQQLGVDSALGLTASEAADRLRTQGPNKLAAAKKESGLKAFVRQYQDFMQIILL